MKFTLTTVIARPPGQVYDLLASQEGLQCMIPNFVGAEPGTGVPGQPGATTRITFRTGSDHPTLLETVVDRSPPVLLANTYEIEAVIYSLIHQLTPAPGGSTRWTCECSGNFNRGGWLSNWLFSRLLQGVCRKCMAQLKARAESAA